MLKVLRSHKFYVPLITIAASVGLFLVYYFFYVASQRSYADERAFRLLSAAGDQMKTKLENFKQVLAALEVARSEGKVSNPGEYLKQTLKENDVADVRVFGPPPEQARAKKREGILRLSLPAHTNNLSVRAEYR